MYWYPAILFFCLLTNNSLHRIYHYPGTLRKLGLKVVEKRHFGLRSLSGYWSILAQKDGSFHAVHAGLETDLYQANASCAKPG